MENESALDRIGKLALEEWPAEATWWKGGARMGKGRGGLPTTLVRAGNSSLRRKRERKRKGRGK
jgi:hypothetical protein